MYVVMHMFLKNMHFEDFLWLFSKLGDMLCVSKIVQLNESDVDHTIFVDSLCGMYLTKIPYGQYFKNLCYADVSLDKRCLQVFLFWTCLKHKDGYYDKSQFL